MDNDIACQRSIFQKEFHVRKYLVIALFALGGISVCAGTLYAPLVSTTEGTSSSSSNSDTSTVDLSDRDTDAPVQSPSFENTTPAGQAPGQPIEG